MLHVFGGLKSLVNLSAQVNHHKTNIGNSIKNPTEGFQPRDRERHFKTSLQSDVPDLPRLLPASDCSGVYRERYQYRLCAGGSS